MHPSYWHTHWQRQTGKETLQITIIINRTAYQPFGQVGSWPVKLPAKHQLNMPPKLIKLGKLASKACWQHGKYANAPAKNEADQRAGWYACLWVSKPSRTNTCIHLNSLQALGSPPTSLSSHLLTNPSNKQPDHHHPDRLKAR